VGKETPVRLEQIVAALKMLLETFAAGDGPVPAIEDDFSVATLDVPGNGGTLRIRFAVDEEAPEEYRFTFEAWTVDADGNRTSEVARGDGGYSPADAMQVSHWRALQEPRGVADPVDGTVE